MPGLGAVIDERRGRVLASIATALAALALVLVPAGPAAAQGATRQSDIPRLRAESWALVDADTGLYLARKR